MPEVAQVTPTAPCFRWRAAASLLVASSSASNRPWAERVVSKWLDPRARLWPRRVPNTAHELDSGAWPRACAPSGPSASLLIRKRQGSQHPQGRHSCAQQWQG